MNLTELRAMVSKDMVMDDTELDIESLRTPQLHNKYLNMYHDERLRLTQKDEELKSLIRSKWEYYTGKMDSETLATLGWEPFQLNILKADIDKYLESDEDLIKAKQKIDYLETVVNYLDRTLKTISSRDWQIRNSIEWRKFTSGAI